MHTTRSAYTAPTKRKENVMKMAFSMLCFGAIYLAIVFFAPMTAPKTMEIDHEVPPTSCTARETLMGCKPTYEPTWYTTTEPATTEYVAVQTAHNTSMLWLLTLLIAGVAYFAAIKRPHATQLKGGL